MNRRGGARRSLRSRDRRGSKRVQGSRDAGRRLGKEIEPTEAERLAGEGWLEWGGDLIWVVGYTSGDAPFGLRPSEFDPSDLQAMGFDLAALEDAGRVGGDRGIDGFETRT